MRRKKPNTFVCQYCKFYSSNKEELVLHEITIHGYHRDAMFRKEVFKPKPEREPNEEDRVIFSNMTSRDGLNVLVSYEWNSKTHIYDIYIHIGDRKLLLIQNPDTLRYYIPNWDVIKDDIKKEVDEHNEL